MSQGFAKQQTTVVTATGVSALTSDPVSPATGQMWYRTDTDQLCLYDGADTERLYAHLSATQAELNFVAGATSSIQAQLNALKKGSISATFDGGGAALVAGAIVDVVCPFAGTITAATTLADQSGSAVVEAQKCTYSQFDGGATHPATGDKISASAPPTLSGAVKAQDNTLTGWATSVNAGDIVRFVINSVSTVQRLMVVLSVTKS